MRNGIAGSVVVMTIAACGGGDRGRAAPTADSAIVQSVEPESTPAAASSRAMRAMPMLPGFRNELDSIAAKPAMLKSSMSAHLAEVHRVMDAMHADMMAAGMHSDPAYEALADSIIQGSAALGTAKNTELTRLVMTHVDQLRRLTAVYERKTATM